MKGFIAPFDVGEHALSIGMLLSNTLMLAAVVDRIMNVRREKEAAQNALLEARAAHGAQLEHAVETRTADLNTALDETRKAHQSQNRLVAFISHDLRAPLATIINYVHLLGRHDDAEVRRYQTTIERSAFHQLELIDDLVEYSRGELDQLELVPAPTYLHDWLDNIAAQAELLAGQHGNRFVLEDGAGVPPIVVFDPKRLRQVLLNLLANAAKFTSSGEIRLQLYLVPPQFDDLDAPGGMQCKAQIAPRGCSTQVICNAAVRPPDAWTNGQIAAVQDIHAEPAAADKVELAFAVKDSGPGISADEMKRIFLPFERGQSEREGYGLGLSIARQLVRAMGGELTAQSAPGQGSRFSFRLVLETATEAEVPQPMQAFAFPESFGAGKTLLVADDNAASRDYLREVLSTADFDVVGAQDGKEALNLALERPFDAVLTDQFMPDLSGWEVLRKLHEALPGAVPPVILCSAMPPQRPEGFPAGLDFNVTLLKPVEANKLLQTLQELFGQQAPSAPLAPPEAILAPLQRMVADGSITEIEEWALELETAQPEYADFARRIGSAAVRIDFAELAALMEASAKS